jgi:hypothetical protein
MPDPKLDSSASSVFNADAGDNRILVLEAEADVDTTDGDAVGIRAGSVGDEGSKKALRDQLRRTLNRKESSPARTSSIYAYNPEVCQCYTFTIQSMPHEDGASRIGQRMCMSLNTNFVTVFPSRASRVR